ncbi:MAG: hypothetical protein JW384_00303 [Nitrosomonadaceae bacterium]|nr:hypothetical protein [Nitrosomonadaceae bacterium]
MNSVSGIPYEEHIQLVETIVSIKKAKYRFPGVDPEDTAQEIRIICWEALSRFDPAKMGKSVFHFVARCVDNRLYNQFRGVYLDNNPPCLRCPEWDKTKKECMIEEIGCDRIVAYRDRMSRRRAIAAPTSYSTLDDGAEGSSEGVIPKSMTTGSLTGVTDMNDQFRLAVREDLRLFYDMMVDGKSTEVPPHIVKLIQSQIRNTIAKAEQ